VGLTGGEPFLRRDLEGIVSSIVARSRSLLAIHINTNGQDPARVAAFAEWFRGRFPRIRLIVTVSVDGAPAVHDAIRGREGAWSLAASTFADLKRVQGVKAQVGFTLTEHNIDGYADAIAALRGASPSLEEDDINVNVFQRSPVYYDNADMPAPDPRPFVDAVERILSQHGGRRSINGFLRTTYLRRYRTFAETGKSPLPCQAFSASCFLDPYGDLYPCIMYDRRFLNVRDMKEGLQTLWKTAEGKRIRRACARQECPSCWTPCDAFSAIVGSLGRALVP
jgi:MoaA/NifB/PqqE/SkfB family radical SAM enzyme